MTVNKDSIRNLIDGDLSWEELKEDVLPKPKDSNRFESTLEVLQERVEWDDPILMPLNDHLFVVGSEEDRLVKAECGHEFCDHGENWKRHTRVRVREGPDEMDDLYEDWMSVDEDWSFQLREFFCPGCLQLLDVDAVPVAYPVLTPFEPDIDTFYEEWLGRPAPDTEPVD